MTPVPIGRCRLTRAGRGLLLASVVFWVVGFVGDRNPFLVVAAVMAPLVLLSYPLSRWSMRGLSVRVRTPARVVAGARFRLGVDVRRGPGVLGSHIVRFMPGAVRGFPLVLVHLAAGQDTRVSARFQIGRRGVHQIEVLQVATMFPFGLVRRTAMVPVDRQIIVHPAPARLVGRLPLPGTQRVVGAAWETTRLGDDEFFGLREYRPGDRMRHIAWRASARLSQLVVKEMRAEADAETSIVLHAPSRMNRSSATLMERAVACAVAAIKAERRAGRVVRLDVRGGVPGRVIVDHQPHSLVRALDLLARYGPGRGRQTTEKQRRHRPPRLHIVPGVARSTEIESDDTIVDVADPAVRSIIAWGGAS
jgi:uncharacterized protein (DUF58 family)